jgi:hypothetical protein
MPMVLEYPMNIVILTVVVIVIIGIMFTFRDKILKICLFPPCQEDIKCDVKSAVVTEAAGDKLTIEKYCNLCWGKNRNGECKEDALCYVVNAQTPDPSGITLSQEVRDYCKIRCLRDVTSFFVEYNFLKKEITIEC